MIKSQLVKRISAQNRHLDRRDVENIVNAILGELTAALANRDRIELRGFGTFSVRNRVAYFRRDWRTGARASIDQKSLPRFKTGKQMHKRLNSTPMT